MSQEFVNGFWEVGMESGGRMGHLRDKLFS